jgi:hypothetical protein
VDPQHRFRIKGDDIISLWTLEQITLYKALAAACGLVVNHKSVISRHYGVYCEADYIREGYKLRRLPTFSLRSYANGTIPGSAVISAYLERGVPADILLAIQRPTLKSWFSLCHEKEVDPYMPEALGGLGLLPPDMNAEVPRNYRRLVQLANNGQLPFVYDDIHTDLPVEKAVRGALSKLRYSVNGDQGFTQAAERLVGHSMTLIAFHRALMRTEVSRIETPGRRVRRLRAFVNRCRNGRDDYPTTYAQAWSVVSRLQVEPGSFFEFANSLPVATEQDDGTLRYTYP